MALFGFGSSTSKANSSSHADPWAPTIDPLKSFIDKAMSVGGLDITPDQMAAFGALKNNAAEGNPFTPQIAGLADWSFNYDNSGQKGMVNDAYSGLKDSLGKYASGDYLDVMKNPELMAMLQTVGSDVQDRINRMYAGAGRDLSGANQTAVAKGVTQAQLPLLLDQFNKQQQNQMAAAGTLFGAGSSTANQQSQLDQLLQSIRSAGIGFGDKALEAKDYAANKILNIDQQIQQLPYENLALLGSLLMPLAGVGGDTSGTSKTKSSNFSISDARVKDNIARVGTLDDGQNVYRFTYRGDPDKRVHIGLLAQEVELHSPDAVREFGGIKAVNYGLATDRAVAMQERRAQ